MKITEPIDIRFLCRVISQETTDSRFSSLGHNLTLLNSSSPEAELLRELIEKRGNELFSLKGFDQKSIPFVPADSPLCVVENPNDRFSFHLLRHFDSIPKVMAKRLESEGLDWKAECMKPGSKWNAKQFQAPQDLWRFLRRNLHRGQWFLGSGGNRLWSSVFPESEYPEGLGWSSLVDLDHLSKAQRDELTYVKRDSAQDYLTPTLPASFRERTWTVSAIWQPGDSPESPWEPVSIFPGILGEPFPKPDEMTVEDYLSARFFWAKHALAL